MKTGRMVIVGGSAAGVSAALAMRHTGYEGGVTVLDADRNLPYERPPLSKTLLGTPPAALVPIVPASTYRELDIELRLGGQVTGLDRTRRHVELAGGERLAADRVLLATGVRARTLAIPGAAAPNVLVLRDASDAAVLAERLVSGGPLVIVGSGFIGLELAALARTRGLDVTVVDVAPLPLLAAAGEPIARMIKELHEQRGVRFRLDATVTAFEGSPEVEAVALNDGERLPAATVVVGVGVIPQDDLARTAGLVVDGFGVVVDGLGTTNDPWVSAAGDVASQEHPALVSRGRLEHWDIAVRHGTAVGTTMAGRPTLFHATPYAWSEQYGLTLQMVGRGRTADEFVLRHGHRPERFIGFWLRDGHLVGACAQDMPREVGASRRLVEVGAALTAGQLADPSVDLRRLARTLATQTA